MSIITPLEIPRQDNLISSLRDQAQICEITHRCINAAETGVFTDPSGKEDHLLDVRLSITQLAWLRHLAQLCPGDLSAETGFGMGSSTTMILASRALRSRDFRHVVFDRTGLAGRGLVVEAYLKSVFPDNFSRVRQDSEIGLPHLVQQAGAHSAGLIFIDGCHLFENVITDFTIAAHLCCIGGFIVFDDSEYPAIETALNYIDKNRPDFRIHHLVTDNTTILHRIDLDRRNWDSFQPYAVADRHDWTAARAN